MMRYPVLLPEKTWVRQLDRFRGYDHRVGIREDSFYETENLTADGYPLMVTRKARGLVQQGLERGGMLGKAQLLLVEGGKLFYGGIDLTSYLTGKGISLRTDTEQQIVSMGSYAVILPDKVYFNTVAYEDCGYLDNTVEASGVKASICLQDGAGFDYQTGGVAPEKPSSGQYWLDTSAEPHSLKVYSSEQGEWTSVATVYVKLEKTGIGRGFSQFDGVRISGLTGSEADPLLKKQIESLNGSHVIQSMNDNEIVIIGILDRAARELSCKIERKMPKMDFVIEAQNRLWGCYYGLSGAETVNEIYCSALGDFKNWTRYEGLSTDSYAASCGTDGPWTGAVNHMGYPVFFKEGHLHKVYVSTSGAHQIIDTACRGVQRGCSKSIAIVNERVYYKSSDGICVYDGSMPASVGDNLGDVRYDSAVAGTIGNKYYISMHRTKEDDWALFCIDTAKGIWMHEDASQAKCFARCGDELYMWDADGKLWAMEGSEGAPEKDMTWGAETGMITHRIAGGNGYDPVGSKYVSMFNIRMDLPKDSIAKVFIQYDSDGIWYPCGTMIGNGIRSFVLPVRPRRCDHFKIRMMGVGPMKVYSFSKVYEEGSAG